MKNIFKILLLILCMQPLIGMHTNKLSAQREKTPAPGHFEGPKNLSTTALNHILDSHQYADLKKAIKNNNNDVVSYEQKKAADSHLVENQNKSSHPYFADKKTLNRELIPHIKNALQNDTGYATKKSNENRDKYLFEIKNVFYEVIKENNKIITVYPIFLFHSYEDGPLQLNIDSYDESGNINQTTQNEVDKKTLLSAARQSINKPTHKDPFNLLKYNFDRYLTIDIAQELEKELNKNRKKNSSVINLPRQGIYLKIKKDPKKFLPTEYPYLYTDDEHAEIKKHQEEELRLAEQKKDIEKDILRAKEAIRNALETVEQKQKEWQHAQEAYYKNPQRLKFERLTNKEIEDKKHRANAVVNIKSPKSQAAQEALQTINQINKFLKKRSKVPSAKIAYSIASEKFKSKQKELEKLQEKLNTL